MASVDNVYNWGELYQNWGERHRSARPDCVNDEGRWCKCTTCDRDYDDGYSSRRCENCWRHYKKLCHNLREKASKLLKRPTNTAYCSDTQCTKGWLEFHMFNLFDTKMSWENKSEYWQIDHRIGIAWFNLENEEERKFALNWKNIQPMEKYQNMSSKNDKWPQTDLFSYAVHPPIPFQQ